MPVNAQVVADWITQQLGWDANDPGNDAAGVPVFPGPYVQKMPDRIVTITTTTGPGFVFEGAADAVGFQARVRGVPSPNDLQSYADAESLAFLLDSLVFNAMFPVTVDGRVFVKAFRSGSQPSPLSPSPDDADRYEFICNYILIVGV